MKSKYSAKTKLLWRNFYTLTKISWNQFLTQNAEDFSSSSHRFHETFSESGITLIQHKNLKSLIWRIFSRLFQGEVQISRTILQAILVRCQLYYVVTTQVQPVIVTTGVVTHFKTNLPLMSDTEISKDRHLPILWVHSTLEDQVLLLYHLPTWKVK